MLALASLGSGSRGNGTVVRTSSTCVLIDCGFTGRQLDRRLGELGLSLDDLSAILVTHEHSDHAGGVMAARKRGGVPVLASLGTWRGMGASPIGSDRVLHAGEAAQIDDLQILPVTVPHDAREPLQFRFASAKRSLGVLTDLGHASAHVVESYRGCDGLLLEFNHDPEMLEGGRYPPHLKRRVGGQLGHLANGQSCQLLDALGPERLEFLVAGHLSQQNNTEQIVDAALDAVIGRHPARVHIAAQDGASPWFELA